MSLTECDRPPSPGSPLGPCDNNGEKCKAQCEETPGAASYLQDVTVTSGHTFCKYQMKQTLIGRQHFILQHCPSFAMLEVSS